MRNIEDQVQVEGTEENVYEYFLSKGWTDGLPITPPTIERVEAFLAEANVASDDIIGVLPPQWAELTVEKLLVNVGGGTPGDMDRATQGMPGKLFFCLAENEDASPWEPFHIEKGYPTDA